MTDPARLQRLLDDIRIAAPCSADWHAMHGRGRVRHCGDCNKRVYNLSALTRKEAVALIEKHGGKVCGRLYRRPDGTVITSDCTLAQRVARGARLGARAVAAIGVAAFMMTVGALLGCSRPVRETGVGGGGPTNTNATPLPIVPERPEQPNRPGSSVHGPDRWDDDNCEMGDIAPHWQGEQPSWREPEQEPERRPDDGDRDLRELEMRDLEEAVRPDRLLQPRPDGDARDGDDFDARANTLRRLPDEERR